MGMRSGVVDRWDSREPGGKTDLVVNMLERPSPWKMTPTIDYIRVIREHQLLVRTMRGDVCMLLLSSERILTLVYGKLETRDLRFLRTNTPLLQFPGFSPSFESKLVSGLSVFYHEPSLTFNFRCGTPPV